MRTVSHCQDVNYAITRQPQHATVVDDLETRIVRAAMSEDVEVEITVPQPSLESWLSGTTRKAGYPYCRMAASFAKAMAGVIGSIDYD